MLDLGELNKHSDLGFFLRLRRPQDEETLSNSTMQHTCHLITPSMHYPCPTLLDFGDPMGTAPTRQEELF
jgi:hypothetical protein